MCISYRGRLTVLILSVFGAVVLVILSVLVTMTSRSEVGVLENDMFYI